MKRTFNPLKVLPLTLMLVFLLTGCPQKDTQTSEENSRKDVGKAGERNVATGELASAESHTREESSQVKGRNRLANETSPYLLQHADNPVDWYPWGEEALEKSRQEDKPILISIGYSACHWCHVMEHESFENPEIAALMNDLFVCIKIDREERPDLDEIYMTSVQMMTGSGGWPLNVFLTPDLKPFFGGTYFPPDAKYGRASWPQVLKSVAEAYRLRRDKVEELAGQISQQIALYGSSGGGGEDQLLAPRVIDLAAERMKGSFDEKYGGFGHAPKFPRTSDLSLLLRRYSKTKDVELLRMVTTTLDGMANGGMYDQLGGGFHRYSTDERWLVPHFEKMLYDNALLSRLYVEAYQVTKHGEYARIAREILDYVEREMTSPEGGFYSSLDADSEGEEGKFYVWTPEEIFSVLGEDEGKSFSRMYDVDEVGHLEGKAIPHVVKSFEEMATLLETDVASFRERWQEWKDRLMAERSKRIRPGLDDKILIDWNGLMIGSSARIGRVLGEERYVKMAASAADFILANMTEGGHLLHSYRDGKAAINGMLDDYGFFIASLLDLWEATFDPRWMVEARRLQKVQDDLFWDGTTAAYFAAEEADDLIVRMKNGHDGSLPNGNGVSIHNLLRLARLTGMQEYEDKAMRALKYFMPAAEKSPQSFSQVLIALDYGISPSQEIVIVGDPGSSEVESLVAVVWERFLPDAVFAGVPVSSDGLVSGPLKSFPVAEGRSLVNGKAAVYVCENYACKAPVTSPAELGAALDGGQ